MHLLYKQSYFKNLYNDDYLVQQHKDDFKTFQESGYGTVIKACYRVKSATMHVSCVNLSAYAKRK